MNQSLLIYFKYSWLFGVLGYVVSYWFDYEVKDFLLVFLFILNGIVNGIFILFQVIMIYFFPENREGFLKMILLLMVNFPFVIFYFLLIIIIF